MHSAPYGILLKVYWVYFGLVKHLEEFITWRRMHAITDLAQWFLSEIYDHMIYTFGLFAIILNEPKVHTVWNFTKSVHLDCIIHAIISFRVKVNGPKPSRDYFFRMLCWIKNHSLAYSSCDFRLNQAYKCRLVFNKPWVGVISSANFEWQLDRTRLTLSLV